MPVLNTHAVTDDATTTGSSVETSTPVLPAAATTSTTTATASSATQTSDALDRARLNLYRVWTFVGAALIVGVVIYLLNLLAIPVAMALWTAVIVFCLRSPVAALERYGVNRLLGTACAYVLLVVVLSLVIFAMFSPVTGVGDQFTNLIESLPNYMTSLAMWLQEFANRYSDVLSNESVHTAINEISSALSTWAASVASASAAGVVTLGSAIINSLIAIGFALVIAFWVLMELPALGRECMRLVGERHREDAEMLHMTFSRVVGGYLKATFLQCAVIGIACGILFAACGIPNAAALGVIAGVLNIIPIIGSWLGGILAAVVGLFVSVWVAVVAVIGTIVIQQFVSAFVSPRLMGDSVDIHPAVTFFALMSGSAIGGAMSGLGGALIGMLLSIPAVAVAKSVFVYYFEKRTGRRIVAADGVLFRGAPREGEASYPIADATAPRPVASATLHKQQTKQLYPHDTAEHECANNQEERTQE